MRDTAIGKRWICSDLERSTLHRVWAITEGKCFSHRMCYGKSFFTLGNPLSGVDWRSFGTSDGNAATGAQKVKWKDHCQPILSSRDTVSLQPAVVSRGWVLRLRLWRSDPRERTRVS